MLIPRLGVGKRPVPSKSPPKHLSRCQPQQRQLLPLMPCHVGPGMCVPDPNTLRTCAEGPTVGRGRQQKMEMPLSGKGSHGEGEAGQGPWVPGTEGRLPGGGGLTAGRPCMS